jgi:hypothetical protein
MRVPVYNFSVADLLSRRRSLKIPTAMARRKSGGGAAAGNLPPASSGHLGGPLPGEDALGDHQLFPFGWLSGKLLTG